VAHADEATRLFASDAIMVAIERESITRLAGI
jgi:hypothetical protein